MRVVLVEDDSAAAQEIAQMLRSEGYVCETASFGIDGPAVGELYDYDIVILDLMLHDSGSYEVLRRLRGAGVRTPVLVLSGLSWLDDKLKGFGVGAEDVLSKPFDRRALIARIQAIVGRAKDPSNAIVTTGKLTVDLDRGTVEVGGRPLALTGKEYGILELLSLHKGTLLTKEMFLDHLYLVGSKPEPNNIDVFLSRLRKKLSVTTGGANYIETIRGRGYVLRDPAPQPLRLRRKRG